MGIGRKGFLPAEGTEHSSPAGTAITRVPLVRGEEPILRSYCAGWKKDNSGYYVEEFAELLKTQFAQQAKSYKRAAPARRTRLRTSRSSS